MRIAACALAALVLAACGGGGAVSAKTSTTHVAQSTTSRVIVILMENKERSSVIGSSSAPYINKLANTYASPTNYYGIRHPSLPNYLAIIGGSTFGVTTNCTNCPQNATTLVDQLETAKVSWKAYMEGMPSACYSGASSGRYAKRHNPFVYFTPITSNAARCAKVVPGSKLDSDLTAGTLPRFVWLTPDLCNDMHDCSVAHGDQYLSQRVPPLLKQVGPHGYLVIAFDEGSTNAGCCGGLAAGGRIPMVIAGPDVVRGAKPATAYSHYSLLRTIEDTFRLSHLRNAGATATTPLNAVFTTQPRLRRR